MKTPEEMAEEYANTQNCLDDRTSRKYAFLAGYKAAMDQLADASKVMDSCKHILHMEKMVDANSPEKPDGSNYSNNSNGWISVKDRLPEGCDPGGDCDYDIKDYPYVLAHSPTDGIHVAYYDTHRGVFETSATTSAYAEELYKVTDWQPLPAPPKGEK